MGNQVPLLIIGTSAGKLLPKAGAWMTFVKGAFGLGLLAIGTYYTFSGLSDALGRADHDATDDIRLA